MAEDFDNIIEETEETEEETDIWKLLDLEDPGDEPYEAEQTEADEEVAKEDKMVKKLSSKLDNMQKKFETTMMHERISKFQDSSDDLERDLFKTIASDVKDMETLDKAMALVKSRAAKLREEADKYRQSLEKKAEEQVASAWGTGPIGTPARRSDTDAKDLETKIAEGDVKAAFQALYEDDPIFRQQ